MGEGIHRITFYSGREMMYKGRRYNLQWTQNGKPSIPPNGSASARTSADKPGEKAQRIGLKTLLKQTIGADRDAWWAVKKLAGEAEQKARADAALPAVLEKIRRPTVTAETRVADAELDSFFADFDTSTGIPRRDDFDYGGEGGMSEMDDDR
jgi:membrane protein involved in colicin uptake